MTDAHTKIRDQIHVSTGCGTRKFILNLKRVEFIDSYGVGELVRSYSVIRQMAGEMKLACVNDRVSEILRISRLNTIFELYADEGAALLAFGANP